jgi:hypothetical protein
MKDFYKLRLVQRVISSKGLGASIVLLLKIIRSKLLGDHRLIFGLAADQLKDLASTKIPNLEIRQFSALDTLNQALQDKLELYAYICGNTKEMFKKGACLWVGYLDGHIASIAYARTGDKVRMYFFPMTSECVLISHCATFPEFRGHSLYATILMNVVNNFATKGFKRFYIDCHDWNTASIKGIKNAGFRLLGRGIAKNQRLIWYQQSRPVFARIDSDGYRC